MPAIETVELSKHFGELAAVDGVSLEVAEGESFALLGPNGAGKSTLIRLLTTLLEPTAGWAQVAGHDIERNQNGVRRSIGVVPQAVTSDPKLTAAENVDFYARLHEIPRARRKELVDELLDWVGLLDWRDKYVGTFSGGMRRRVEIARSLVHQPKVLFLDEPTTGLDPTSRVAMWEMVGDMKARREMTVFLTTHYMEEAEQTCDRVAIFDEGRVVALGTPQELVAKLPAAETIEVAFSTSPKNWQKVLGELPGVESLEQSDGLWRIHCLDRAVVLNGLMKATSKRRLRITELTVRRNTLQDVFIHFTGRDLRDAAKKLRLDGRLLHQG
jgi:ABC-2 type transport system ATP-binding protein